MSQGLHFTKVRLGLRKKLLILVFLFFFFCGTHNVFASPDTDTMLGYWKFDEGVGTTANDSSGDTCAGTLVGGPPPNYFQNTLQNTPATTFANTNSINFNGASSYVTFSNQNNLRPATALTFSTWIYLNAFPTATSIIGGNYSTGSPNQGYYFSIGTSQVTFSVGNGSTPTPVSFPITNLPVGTWKLLTATWDGITIRLFLNGTEMNSILFSGPISYASTMFTLGNANPSTSFNGKLDDVRLYNRALFPLAEISYLAAGEHLTSSWVGTSTNYDDLYNWSPKAVPDPYTHVKIDSSTATAFPVLTSDESVASLEISSSSSSLDLRNYNFTINDSRTFINNGTLKLNNTQTLTGFTNDSDSGTIQITGSTASTTGLKTDGSSTIGQYYNLIMASTGAITLNKDLIINNNLTLEAGTLNASAHGIILNGNWIKGSGTFDPGSGTVSLNGLNQSISGSNNFYNLTKSTSTARTLTFQADSRQTITNHLLFQGAGSTSQFLSLRSSTSGTRWIIDPQGARDVSGLDVQDSANVSGIPIILPGINKNSGYNLGWAFDTTAPALTLDAVSSPTANARQAVTGIATESNVAVSLVSFRVDSSTTWNPCLAKDGAFDSSSEIFSCKPASDLADGQHTVYVRAQDSNDSLTADNNYASISFKVDTRAPDVSSVSADPDSDSAKITWHTDENSSSRVEYGKDTSYAKSSSESENVKDHGITISDLSSCTEYHYRVKSKDAAGNEGKSSDHTFKTTGCSTASSSGSSSSSGTSSSSSSSASTDTSSPEPNTQTASTNTTSTQNIPAASSATSTAPAISNFNGTTSDDWQVKYFGGAYCSIESKCGGAADPDGDGLSNEEEFRLGTNPLKTDSDNDGLGDNAEIESGHDPTKSAASDGGDSITYESPKEGGTVVKEKYEVKNVEIVESDGNKKLKISGKGPPNTYVTVYIYSDPIVLTIKTDSDGNWSYVLDQDIGDGQHEVYVAVTDNTGKVEEKSEPLSFIKTAEAVTIIPPAEAAAAERAASPTEAWYKGGIFLFISIVFAGLMLALGSIGIYKHKMSKKIETGEAN